MACLYLSYEHRARTCLPHLSHSPSSPTLFVILTLVPCIDFCNAAPLFLHTFVYIRFFKHTVHVSSVMFLGGACVWRCPFLGDAYAWRRVCLAMPPSWRRIRSATPVATSSLCLLSLYPWSCTSSGKKIKN